MIVDDAIVILAVLIGFKLFVISLITYIVGCNALSAKGFNEGALSSLGGIMKCCFQEAR